MLFILNNTYESACSPDEMRTEIRSVLNSGFSHNITGRFSDDFHFKVQPRWTLGYVEVFGMLQSLTYLTGTLEDKNGATIIKTVARPNYSILLVFWLMILMMMLKAAGFAVFTQTDKTGLVLIFTILCTLLGAIMYFGAVQLRNRFERLLFLNRKEES